MLVFIPVVLYTCAKLFFCGKNQKQNISELLGSGILFQVTYKNLPLKIVEKCPKHTFLTDLIRKDLSFYTPSTNCIIYSTIVVDAPCVVVSVALACAKILFLFILADSW